MFSFVQQERCGNVAELLPAQLAAGLGEKFGFEGAPH